MVVSGLAVGSSVVVEVVVVVVEVVVQIVAGVHTQHAVLLGEVVVSLAGLYV